MSKKEFDIVAVGDALVDVFFNCNNQLLLEAGLTAGDLQLLSSQEEAQRLYQLMNQPKICSGGTLPNSLTVMAGLGAKTAFIGKVRDDPMGNYFCQDLEKSQIIFRGERCSVGEATGQCLIFVTPDKERTMNTFLGISKTLGPNDVDEETIKAGQIIYVESYAFGNQDTTNALLKTLRIAKKHQSTVALSLSDALCVERNRKAIQRTIERGVDILIGNEKEYLALYQETNWQMAVRGAKENVGIVVCTRGSEGSYLENKTRKCNIAAPKSNIIDTTGAGDAYAGGFLYGCSQGWSIEECGQIATICAKEVMGALGARPQNSLKKAIQMVR